jgi:hypothetical protein
MKDSMESDRLAPTTRFAYMRPENHRDPVPMDIRFMMDCGIRVEDLRDQMLVLRD